MNNLSETLKQQARSLGLCDEWFGEWAENSSQQELIDKYVKGIDFAIKHQYPSNDFIKENFDHELLNKNLIFVDEFINEENAPSGIYIINGECSGSIRVSPWAVATIYVRHTSSINIVASDFAKVFVRLYDNAEVETSTSDGAVVKVCDRRSKFR